MTAISDRVSYANATKNDFVMVDDPEGTIPLGASLVRELASALNTDGVIRIIRTEALGEPGMDAECQGYPEWFMDYRNSDGSFAQMCGNGVRAFAAYVGERGYVTDPSFAVMTRAGVRTVDVLERGPSWRVRVGMGPVTVADAGRKARISGRWLTGIDVNVGNPHLVVRLPEGFSVDELDLSTRPVLDPEPPEGANVEFVEAIGDRHVAMRVFERGVGETLSCGTGATAVAAALAHEAADSTGEPWTIEVRGGTLTIGFLADGHMSLSGPAELEPWPAGVPVPSIPY